MSRRSLIMSLRFRPVVSGWIIPSPLRRVDYSQDRQMTLVTPRLHNFPNQEPRVGMGVEVRAVAVRAAVASVSVVRGIVKCFLDFRVPSSVEVAF